MFRLQSLRGKMSEQGVEAVIVSKEANLHYFSGFRGDDTMLVVSADNAILVTDSRYTEQARLQAAGFEIVEQKDGLLQKVVDVIQNISCNKIGFEGKNLCYDKYCKMTTLLPKIEFISVDLDLLRSIKDETEIDHVRSACRIADLAFEHILSFVHAGLTELDVAVRLESFMREQGSEGLSFPTIVASGIRGALPHAAPTDKVIEEGEFVTIDYGAVVNGYHSDITRTFCVGKADDKQQKIYQAVLETQLLGLKTIRPNVSGKEVDAIVRNKLSEKELGVYFGHGLGHGVGLEIHEAPTLSQKSNCKALQANMLVTNEPGVYIPKWGGIRIEDTVLVTKDGAKPLTHASKDLIEV